MATSAASSTAAARTPQRPMAASTTTATTSAASSAGTVKRVRKTPSGVAMAAAAASALLTPSNRRAPPKAKLNINFSASKASSSIAVRAVASARTPLRVVANGVASKSPAKPPAETKPPVDVSKILRGVYAMVDVRVGKDAEIDCSDAVARKLVEMGATIMKKKSGRLTHVVVSHYTDQWKEKVTKWQSVLTPVEVVSQLWVNACFHNQRRMSEKSFFPVNKGGAVAAKTPARASSTTTRVAKSSTKKEPATGAAATTGAKKKAATKTSPARSVASELAAAATPGLFQTGDIVASTPGTQASTPAPSLRAGVTRKRRAQSMEPMASDAILKLLETSKKLQKQSNDTDALTTRALLLHDATPLTSTPVRRTRRQTNQSSTPPLTVRLRAAIERRKTISSASSISKELEDARHDIAPAAIAVIAAPVVTTAEITTTKATAAASSQAAADCVAESCSEGENEETKASSVAEIGTEPVAVATSTNPSATTGPLSTPAKPQIAARTLSLNIASPVASAKGEWACSICSCLNAKTRRLCKGCKASRVAAKTCAVAPKSPLVEKTPTKRPPAKAVATTPTRGRTPTTNPPVPSKAPPSAKKSPVLAKRPRYSSDLDTNGSVRSVNLINSEKRDTVTPATKRQRRTPPSVKTPSTGGKATPARIPGTASKKVGPPRAVIGITGVDSETRGVIECAVHGIDANAASEEGYRKARVVKSVDYAAGVTHLIVGRDTKRTIKVLFAIARGAWILSEGWVFTSLEQEKWLKEEDYELSTFPARHLRQEPEQRQVFRTFKFFVGSKIDPSREVLISLLQCAGGEVVNQIAGADYCICGDETLFRRAKRTKIKGVTPKWVFDSIAHLGLEDHTKYEFASVEKKDEAE